MNFVIPSTLSLGIRAFILGLETDIQSSTPWFNSYLDKGRFLIQTQS
jgi:hypothetical protein